MLCCAGACLKPPKHCWLLCEYLPGGTLMAWLYGDKNRWALQAGEPVTTTLEHACVQAAVQSVPCLTLCTLSRPSPHNSQPPWHCEFALFDQSSGWCLTCSAGLRLGVHRNKHLIV